MFQVSRPVGCFKSLYFWIVVDEKNAFGPMFYFWFVFLVFLVQCPQLPQKNWHAAILPAHYPLLIIDQWFKRVQSQPQPPAAAAAPPASGMKRHRYSTYSCIGEAQSRPLICSTRRECVVYCPLPHISLPSPNAHCITPHQGSQVH